MTNPSTAEVDRLKKTYRDYREGGYDRRWSSENPGNREMVRERQAAMQALLAARGLLPLTGRRVLDVGCGTGAELAHLLSLGAEARHLKGVDLLPARVAAARAAYPELAFSCANAEFLAYPDSAFDLVMLFTVLSSILDPVMENHLCAEVGRILKPGGAVLFYDFRFRNPVNPQVRGLTRRQLRRLFPGYALEVRSLTLLPPLARRLGRWTKALYPILASIPFLRTHLLGLLIKPDLGKGTGRHEAIESPVKTC
jgi:ubiquinone/menaquinone biosynthesis C-methylase UbiE